ncbi:unnamed protein product [Brassica rapa subsp. narinosa]
MYCLLGFLQFFNHAMGKLTSLSFGFYVDRANVYAEKKEDRMMMTGLHTVADIYFC